MRTADACGNPYQMLDFTHVNAASCKTPWRNERTFVSE
jgi:hypothetical protein